jgi:ATP-dependent Clp protease protease subunit
MIRSKALENSDGTRIDFNDISLESLGCHLIFGEVNEETMKEAVTFLLKGNRIFDQGNELTLYVNSLGGACSDGFALIDLMDISRLPVRTIASGAICSMGVLISCAGHKGKRVMTRNTEVMAHQFAWYSEGKYHELVAQHKAQEYLAHQFMQHFLRHSKMSEAQIKDVLFGPSDRWLSPQECKKFGLIDTIIDELPPVPAAQRVVSAPVVPAKRQRAAQKQGTVARKKR